MRRAAVGMGRMGVMRAWFAQRRVGTDVSFASTLIKRRYRASLSLRRSWSDATWHFSRFDAHRATLHGISLASTLIERRYMAFLSLRRS
jgi:hypothetical protein